MGLGERFHLRLYSKRTPSIDALTCASIVREHLLLTLSISAIREHLYMRTPQLAL
jgi:hypothetical protein